MKIAYIILCHKNSKQINHLIEKLLVNKNEVFLHIDLKSNIRDEIVKNKRVHILPKEQSYSIRWGGNDMILATLSLIKYVKNYNKDFDYIWLISGQDYPIRNMKEIDEFLFENKKYNFIEVINDKKIYNRYKKLYELWYPKWITKDNIFIKVFKRTYMFITGGFYYTFPIFRRKKAFDFDFNFGSQWWTLTTECAFYILDYCDKNPDYVNYFNNTIIPDECFFQTIFMNSPYKNYYKKNLTFVNWKNNRRSPEIITIDEDMLLKEKSSYDFIARKFDIDIDKKIITKIDKRINGEE